MKKLFCYATFAILSIANVYSSDFRLDNWKVYSSLKQLNYTVSTGKDVFCAGNGGMLKYSYEKAEITEYRSIKQLSSIFVTSLKYDPSSKLLFIGHRDGYIDILDSNGKFTYISDIKQSVDFTNRIITDFEIIDNKLYISGGFGLAIYDLDRNIFLENIRRLGNIQINTKVNDILIQQNDIILATDLGITKASLSSLLTNPSSWSNIPTNPTTLKTPIIDVINFESNIYFSTENEIYRIDNDTITKIHSHGDKINDFFSHSNKLYFTDPYATKCLDGSQIEYQIDGINRVINNSTVINLNGKDYFAGMVNEYGVVLISNSDTIKIEPNTPLTNSFRDMSFDTQGSLWIATNWYNEPTGKGILKFDGSKWDIFTTESYPAMLGNNCFKIKSAPDGRIFTQHYGGGLMVFQNDISKPKNWDIKTFNTSNSPLYGTNESWCIPCETAIDQFGIAWIVNRGEQNPGSPLVAMDSYGKFYEWENKQEPSNRAFISICIDNYGTKWLGGNPLNGRGLLYINEMNTLDDTADDINGMINTGDLPALLSNEHTAIEVDQYNSLWIGSPNGLAIMLNSSAVLRRDMPTIFEAKALEGQSVNDILIDPQNQKWIATLSGIWVIDPQGYEVIARITTDNSPLSTNDIKCLSLNEKTGEIFIGTTNGLFSAMSLSIKPDNEFNITCSPQPFVLHKDKEVIIDGLASEAEIRIVTLNGQLIRKIETNSQKAIWDGRNEDGSLVGPGIYLILGKSGDSNQNGIGKIAVIRK